MKLKTLTALLIHSPLQSKATVQKLHNVLNIFEIFKVLFKCSLYIFHKIGEIANINHVRDKQAFVTLKFKVLDVLEYIYLKRNTCYGFVVIYEF